MTSARRSGETLLRVLAALANPQRIRILGALVAGRPYVSQLARDIGMSRPLLHMHLQRLEAAGLVSGTLELSGEGKAMKYFEVVPFAVRLTPALIAAAAQSLGAAAEQDQMEGLALPILQAAPEWAFKGTPATDATIAVGAVICFAVIISALIWQVATTWRARMSAAGEDAYQRLAITATEARTRATDGLERATAELTELRQRMGEIERVLKEVGYRDASMVTAAGTTMPRTVRGR